MYDLLMYRGISTSIAATIRVVCMSGGLPTVALRQTNIGKQAICGIARKFYKQICKNEQTLTTGDKDHLFSLKH